jgi:Protein tyrosine and serine/threonine kinase
MNNAETMEFVRSGKRMGKPSGGRWECPQKLYEVMSKCWHKTPEGRPTFDFLYHFFDNFGTATEQQYEET